MDTTSLAIGQLQAKVEGVQQDVAEIKADVKSLLESKWRRDGRPAIIAALIAGAVALIGKLGGS